MCLYGRVSRFGEMLGLMVRVWMEEDVWNNMFVL